MSTHIALSSTAAIVLAAALAAQGPVKQPSGLIGSSVSLSAQPIWPGYAGDQYHNANARITSQPLNRILWQTPVDLQPQYTGSSLLIHYGSPLVTPAGTVLVTVKTGATSGFRVEAHQSGNGNLLWQMTTDYRLPSHNWVPSCGSTLLPTGSLATPASGGTILVRSQPDSAAGTSQRVAFYGLASYTANQSTYDNRVFINTPITCDAAGNLYFGFTVTNTVPTNLQSGLARISASGTGSWVSAQTASGDAGIRKVIYNCAPALSRDGSSVYVGVNSGSGSGFGTGYLLKLNSTTLATQASIRLRDPRSSTTDATLADDGTASPTVGPDGDVFFGVLETPFGSNHLRGFMLHFDGALTQTKIPGAFGWDDTASIVPAQAVPSYTGPSSYLILTKYNDYGGGAGGSGLNKLGVLDPNTSMVDPISGATVMNEVLTVLGPTPDPSIPGGVREWCINTGAIDVANKSALVNSEDGKLYRWDFVTNTLIQPITLTAGIGEAYTPTIVGDNGVVYAINNAILFAVGN
jgi:hypothetical protein